MCLGDALDDGQAEADTGMVSAYAFVAAHKRFSEGGDELRAELPPVFSTVSVAASG